jgi:hypothetical protein
LLVQKEDWSRVVPRNRFTLAALALLATSASCREPIAPKNVVVTLSVDGPPTPVITDTPDGPRITCSVQLTATAEGQGSAAWGGLKADWYVGADRSKPVGTTTNAPNEVIGSFGAASIHSGEKLHATWNFWYGAPFEAALGVDYTTSDGNAGTAATRVQCGPGPEGAVTPTITQITLPSTSGELAIGDTVSVSYQETSSSGVWMSDIAVTGGFMAEQKLGEHLATNVNRTVKFVVPSYVHVGIPLTISILAYDAALRRRARSLETRLAAVDHIPPTLGFATLFDIPGFYGSGLAGQFAVGDTVYVRASAYDNNVLGWLVYQVESPADFRDSVAAPTDPPSQELSGSFAVRPEWVGSPMVSVYVRDASGLASQALSSLPDSVRFYPTVQHPVTGPLPLSSASGPDDIAYDAKRDLVYIALLEDKQILVLSPSTMTLGTPIVLPSTISGMDLSLSGDSLLVALPSENEIAVVDLNNPQAAPTAIKLSLLDTVTSAQAGIPVQPSGLRVAANGKALVFLSQQTLSNDQVMEVDLTNGAQRFRTDARSLRTNSPWWARVLGRTNDHSRIYILGSCKAVYDANSDSFTSCAYPPDNNGPCLGITTDESGAHITCGSEVLDAGLHVLTESRIKGTAARAAISPDGATVYMAGDRDMRTMRLTDKTMLERSSIPLFTQRLFVAPSGNWLLVFGNPYGSSSAQVARVDLQ